MLKRNTMEVIDHLQRKIAIPVTPRRIISLCPSITDTLFELGLGERIVGRTRYCIHPVGGTDAAEIVGGTKQVNYDRINTLAPDLIIAEKEENPKDMVEQLAEKYPVYVTNVESVAEALQMIRDVGGITGTSDAANKLVQQIEGAFQTIARVENQKVAYLIWRKPYMVVGASTYINSMLTHIGWSNPFQNYVDRYPAVTIEELRDAEPDFLFLSSEPFPFTEEHIGEFKDVLSNTQIVLVDGEMFSWYGARMVKVPQYVNELIHKLRNEQ